MFLSLLVAGVLWVWIAWARWQRKVLAMVSLVCVVLSVALLPLMAQAIEQGGFGLYQRLNYGAQALWVFALALTVLTRQRQSN